MKIVISNKAKFNAFSNIFRYLPVFMDTVNIFIKETGIYMQGMDTAQVALAELKIENNWFNKYETDKDYVLGIHCATFYKVIQCIEDTEQKMTLTYDDGDNLKIAIESDEKTLVNKYFELPLIDIDSEVLHIPDTDYDIDMEISSNSITNYTNQLMIFDDEFTITCTQENIYMKSKSESGSLKIEMSEDSILLYAIDDELEKLELNFSLTYVKNICAFSKITQSVVINIKENTPMRFHQSLDEDEVEIFSDSKNYIRFYIAPKIDD